MRHKHIFGMLFVVVLFVGFAAGYFTGIYTRGTDSCPAVFYAEVLEIDDNIVLVDGLPINDINGRGTYYFGNQKDEFDVVWRKTERTVEDLKVGQTVAIYHTGGIVESSPAGIVDVIKVQILDDTL